MSEARLSPETEAELAVAPTLGRLALRMNLESNYYRWLFYLALYQGYMNWFLDRYLESDWGLAVAVAIWIGLIIMVGKHAWKLWNYGRRLP